MPFMYFLQRGNLTYLLCGENGLCDSLDQVRPDTIIAVICVVIFCAVNIRGIDFFIALFSRCFSVVSSLHDFFRKIFSSGISLVSGCCVQYKVTCQLSSTLMQLFFWFDQGTKVQKTLVQTLTCQLLSTLMQLLFLFDQDMRVEKTLIPTLASQLPSTFM